MSLNPQPKYFVYHNYLDKGKLLDYILITYFYDLVTDKDSFDRPLESLITQDMVLDVLNNAFVCNNDEMYIDDTTLCDIIFEKIPEGFYVSNIYFIRTFDGLLGGYKSDINILPEIILGVEKQNG